MRYAWRPQKPLAIDEISIALYLKFDQNFEAESKAFEPCKHCQCHEHKDWEIAHIDAISYKPYFYYSLSAQVIGP